MRVVVQKVTSASVSVEPDYRKDIGGGLLLLVGVSDTDGDAEVEWVAHKVANLRIFEDDAGKMNRSVMEVKGSILSVSQFTLFADVHKGNRPSFVRAGEPHHAEKIWKQLDSSLASEYGLPVQEGQFGTHMEVQLLNDGPVTILLDTASDMKH